MSIVGKISRVKQVSNQNASFFFPSICVWCGRIEKNKDVLERLKTDQDYVYALLADLEKAQK